MTTGDDLDLLSAGAKLLFENGQTTERTVIAVEQIGTVLGYQSLLFPHWGELSIRINGPAGPVQEVVAAQPAGVDMNKVAATTKTIDDLCDGRIDVATARSSLDAINRYPPVGMARFALMAAAGAAALGVIFGTAHWFSLGLIGLSAGLGACLRRWLAGLSHNLFIQPFCAALLAGSIGAVAVRLQLSSALRLIALCPCMVLVPGPHLLNGAMDLIRGRLSLGSARIGYALLIILAICSGLLLGLSIGGVGLPASGTATAVPIAYAGFGFASVVSLIPGVFLFRMAGGLVELIAQGQRASPELLLSTVADGMTAALIFIAMIFGLIAPKLLIEHFKTVLQR